MEGTSEITLDPICLQWDIGSRVPVPRGERHVGLSIALVCSTRVVMAQGLASSPILIHQLSQGNKEEKKSLSVKLLYSKLQRKVKRAETFIHHLLSPQIRGSSNGPHLCIQYM